MKYYSTFKKKDILEYATTQVNLEDIMLSEISQSQKDKYCMIPLYEVLRVVKIIKTKNKMVPSRGGGWIMGELLFTRYSISVLRDEKSYGDERW